MVAAARSHVARRLGCIATIAAIATCVLPAPPHAVAETLKDRVKEHVVEGVERSKEKAKRKRAAEQAAHPKQEPAAEPTHPAQPEPSPPAEPAPATEPGATEPATPPETEPANAPAAAAPAPAPAVPTEPKPEPALQISFGSKDVVEEVTKEPEKPTGPPLPVRVFGDDFKLDVTVGAGYRGWYPQQYKTVAVDIASYLTWNIDVKAKLFKFLSLRRGYYESNGVSAPRTEEAAVAATIGSYAPKAAWLLGVIGIPISRVWEPQIRYESRAFDTKAVPHSPVCVVPRAGADVDPDTCMGTTEPLKIISSFETFVAGVRYDQSKTGGPVVEQKGTKVPPLFFGAGLMQYRKPYQVNVDGFALDELLFNGRFRGAGLALGADLGGGLDRFFGDADVQLGLGEVSLTDDLTLNEVVSEALPSSPLIGYVQGSAGLGYRWTMIHAAPTLILVPQVRAGGATFFLVNTKTEQGQDSTSPSLNWDFLWTVQLSLLVPL